MADEKAGVFSSSLSMMSCIQRSVDRYDAGRGMYDLETVSMNRRSNELLRVWMQLCACARLDAVVTLKTMRP